MCFQFPFLPSVKLSRVCSHGFAQAVWGYAASCRLRARLAGSRAGCSTEGTSSCSCITHVLHIWNLVWNNTYKRRKTNDRLWAYLFFFLSCCPFPTRCRSHLMTVSMQTSINWGFGSEGTWSGRLPDHRSSSTFILPLSMSTSGSTDSTILFFFSLASFCAHLL